MNNGIKIVLFSSVALAGAYIIYRFKKNNESMINELDNDNVDNNNLHNFVYIDTDDNLTPVFPIKRGDNGKMVKMIQKSIGLKKEDVTGMFDENTESVLFSIFGIRKVRKDDLKKILDNKDTKETKDNINKNKRDIACSILKSYKDNYGEIFEIECIKTNYPNEAKKVLNDFILTNDKLNDSGFSSYNIYDTISPVKIINGDNLIMYDRVSGKYFYTSPLNWSVIKKDAVSMN